MKYFVGVIHMMSHKYVLWYFISWSFFIFFFFNTRIYLMSSPVFSTWGTLSLEKERREKLSSPLRPRCQIWLRSELSRGMTDNSLQQPRTFMSWQQMFFVVLVVLQLLGVDGSALGNALTHKKLTAKGEEVGQTILSPRTAHSSCFQPCRPSSCLC